MTKASFKAIAPMLLRRLIAYALMCGALFTICTLVGMRRAWLLWPMMGFMFLLGMKDQSDIQRILRRENDRSSTKELQ